MNLNIAQYSHPARHLSEWGDRPLAQGQGAPGLRASLRQKRPGWWRTCCGRQLSTRGCCITANWTEDDIQQLSAVLLLLERKHLTTATNKLQFKEENSKNAQRVCLSINNRISCTVLEALNLMRLGSFVKRRS